jgi:hypothetical protein
MEKEFKFTIKDKKGKVYVETIATFGSKEYPFPDDWKENAIAQMSIMNFKEKILNEHFTIEVSEDLEFTLPGNE